MKLLEKTNSLNFESILIISYGRSGSTLLQGVLNSIDGIVIRGENMNMCFHMFKTYQAILKTKTHNGESIQSPFYGADLLDEEYFLNQTKETVKKLLLGDLTNDSTVKCYGFKEIRYLPIQDELIGFIQFLAEIFPKPCFVFNTRNNEDVIKSWVNLGWTKESNKEKDIKKLKNIEALFINALNANNTNSFHISYDDVVRKTERLEQLFSFLGVPFIESKIDTVLSLPHSYKPVQKKIKKLTSNASIQETKDNYRHHRNILIDKHKVIFYIIPKNACTSMKAHIIEILGLEKSLNYPMDIHNPEFYHYPFVKIGELNSDYQNYLRFCIVRNPWDRLVSCFKDKIRALDFNSEGYKNGVALPLLKNSPLFYGGMPFDEFVEVICNIPDSNGEHHFASQLYQITDAQGNLLVNYIGKLETLNEDLFEISQKSGFPITGFPQLHKTKVKSYQAYYTDELKEKVRIRYAADIGFFKYEFDEEPEKTTFRFLDEVERKNSSNSKWMIPILKEKINLKNKGINIQLKNQLNVQANKLHTIQNSISWKITTPLRMIGSLFTNSKEK